MARTLARVLAAALVWCLASSSAHALNPKSPEVKKLVQLGVEAIGKESDQRPGANALFGLTVLKAEVKPSDPVVQKAIQMVREAQSNTAELQRLDVYSVALSIIFLVELDPQAYKAELSTYLNHLLKIQKPHGGWGYPERTTGDTSMTQYAVLAMWECSKVGIDTPATAWDNVTNWLIRTQDPSGAWGYQGVDPGVGVYKLVAQTDGIRPSMSAAGLGSLYICADHYQYRRRVIEEAHSDSTGLLQKVRKTEPSRRPAAAPQQIPTKVDLTLLGQALDRGDPWMEANYTVTPGGYAHYFLYAFERYQSFRELATNRAFTPSSWYDDGVHYLEKTQMGPGVWYSQTGAGTDTCFAMLFLLRSSKKSIERVNHLGPGTLVSGRGLPDGANVELRMGQVRAKPLAGPAEELLAAMEDPGHPDYLRAVDGLEDKVDTSPPAELERLADRLRRLAGGDDPTARIAALRALGRTRNLDNVPLMLVALQDPDDDVFLAAEEALRYMSRTITPPGDTEGVTAARRASALHKWRKWYLAIRPKAELED